MITTKRDCFLFHGMHLMLKELYELAKRSGIGPLYGWEPHNWKIPSRFLQMLLSENSVMPWNMRIRVA